MKKLRYGKSKPIKVEHTNKKQEYINKFLKRAEAVTTESEARKLLSEALGKKNVFIELFGKVAEIIKSKGIIANK
jgi:hypothetical protein